MASGANSKAVRTTWATNGRPASSCNTFARRDFIRVPNPAARIITSVIESSLRQSKQAELPGVEPSLRQRVALSVRVINAIYGSTRPDRLDSTLTLHPGARGLFIGASRKDNSRGLPRFSRAVEQ